MEIFYASNTKKLYKHKTPFYGINSGDYGFLMNKFSKINFYNDILKSKKISISPLVMKVISRNKTKKEAIAINEVSILRQSRQAASLSIKVNKKYLIKKLRGMVFLFLLQLVVLLIIYLFMDLY